LLVRPLSYSGPNAAGRVDGDDDYDAGDIDQLTQAELAKRIGSSQARVAKMEGGDPQASLESMIRALVATGYRARLQITRHRAA
jgi:hypothetical protein